MNQIPWQQIIDRYYPAGSPLRDIYLRHCTSVTDEALRIAREKDLPLNPEDIRAAAMLHDIGVFLTDAPSIECHGKEPYIRHGVLGAALLRREGVPEHIAAVAERHTGSGLSAEEIRLQNLPLEQVDYLPATLLEKLVCYADKFYSQSGSMKRKDYESVRRSMARFGQESLQRFDDLHRMFSDESPEILK